MDEKPIASITAVKMYRCSDGTFIHVVYSNDYSCLCRYLITPADMDAYLAFREKLLLNIGDVDVPEQYIFVHFFERPETHPVSLLRFFQSGLVVVSS